MDIFKIKQQNLENFEFNLTPRREAGNLYKDAVYNVWEAEDWVSLSMRLDLMSLEHGWSEESCECQSGVGEIKNSTMKYAIGVASQAAQFPDSADIHNRTRARREVKSDNPRRLRWLNEVESELAGMSTLDLLDELVRESHEDGTAIVTRVGKRETPEAAYIEFRNLCVQRLSTMPLTKAQYLNRFASMSGSFRKKRDALLDEFITPSKKGARSKHQTNTRASARYVKTFQRDEVLLQGGVLGRCKRERDILSEVSNAYSVTVDVVRSLFQAIISQLARVSIHITSNLTREDTQNIVVWLTMEVNTLAWWLTFMRILNAAPIKEILSKFTSICSFDWLSFVTRWVAKFMADSKEAFSTTVATMLESMTFGSVPEMELAFLELAKEECVIGQATSVTVTSVDSVWQRLRHGKMTVLGVNLLFSMLGEMASSLDPSKGAGQVTTHLLMGLNAVAGKLSIIDQILAWVAYIERRIGYVKADGSRTWWDLFENRPEVEALNWCASIQERYRDIRNSKKESMGADLDKLALEIRMKSGEYGMIPNKTVIAAVAAVVDLTTQMAASKETTRKEPYGVIIRGPPGCGKSTAVAAVAQVLKNYFGISPGDNVILQEDKTIKHQQVPNKCLIHSINDAFQIADTSVDSGSSINVFQSAVDSTMKRVETATIQEKAFSQVAPMIVSITTNAERFLFASMPPGQYADKMDRRYTMVIAEWDEDYIRDTYGSRFDRTAYLNAVTQGHPQDLRLFKWKAGYMNNSRNVTGVDTRMVRFEIETVLAENMTYLEMINFIAQEAIKKYTGVDSRMCPKCKVFTCVCAVMDSLGTAECAGSNALSVTPKVIRVPQPIHKPTDEVIGQGGVFSLSHTVSFTDRIHDEIRKTRKSIDSASNKILEALSFLCKTIAAIAGAMLTINLVTTFFARNSVVDQGPKLSHFSSDGDEAYVQKSGRVEGPWLGSGRKGPPPGLYRLMYQEYNQMQCVYAVAMHDYVLVTVKHFFDRPSLSPGQTLFIEHVASGQIYEMEYSTERVIKNQLNDLALVVTIEKLVNPQIALVPYKTPNLHKLNLTMYRANGVWDKLSFEGFRGNELACSVARPTVSGECGLPIYDDKGTLVGFHKGILSQKQYAISVPLNIETLGPLITGLNSLFPLNIPLPTGIPVIQGQSGLVSVFGNLHPDVSPKSDAGYMMRELGSRLCRLQVLGHTTSIPKVKNTCYRTELYPIYGSLTEQFVAAPSGKARRGPDGLWYSPITNILRVMDKAPPNLEPVILYLERAVDYYVDHIPREERDLEPYDWRTVMLGHPHNSFVNARDMSKAIGPSLTSKGVTKEQVVVEWAGRHVFNKVLKEELDTIEDYIRGRSEVRPMMNVKGTDKNAVVTEAAFAKGKGRIFFVCDLSFNLMLRKYLLPILAHLRKYKGDSKINVDMNAAGPEWNDLMLRLSRFGENNLMDGDYKHYDISHNSQTLRLVICVYIKLARKLGYHEDDVVALGKLLEMILHFTVYLGGDVFLADFLPSGRTDTIDTNCIVNALLVIGCAFYQGIQDPYELIDMAFTGDDNLLAADKSRFEPSKLTEFAELCGYTLTAADKTGPVRWMNIMDITYLKRSNRKINGRYVGALEKKSIYKSLCYMVDLYTEEDLRMRMLNTVLCAQKEMFLHGREEYDAFVSLLPAIYPRKLYDEYLDDFEAGHFNHWLVGPRDLQYLTVMPPDVPQILGDIELQQ